MSVLETPRIYFKGQVSWDPITTNNYSQTYDEFTGETIFPAVMDKVQAFRKQSIEEVAAQTKERPIGGNWNPHGTHRVAFYQAGICGFNTGSGDQTSDPFMNAGAGLNAMLVDLEPYGSMSSQLFFNSICFGVDGGYRILAPRSHRFIARYINFNRVGPNVTQMIAGGASVIWQTSFAKSDGLRIDAYDSPALKSLAAALEDDDVLGITIRFNVYRTVYFNNPQLTNPAYNQGALPFIETLKKGGFQPNPARSRMVGVIGLWRKGEPVQEPAERPLIQFAAAPGTAYARVDSNSLTLDLSNSIPEVDNSLKKQDYGTLNVVAIDPSTQAPTQVASIAGSQYDRAAYEGSAGIVTTPLAEGVTGSTIAAWNLQLQDSEGNSLLKELPLRAIPSTPNLYLDEGELQDATFQVFERGIPATGSVTFTLYQTDNAGNPTGSTTVSTDANGVLTIPISGTGGTVTGYVPSFSSADAPARGINPPVNTYMYVRVRPADAAISQLKPTWENVYVNVLANWNAMAPCMDNWLNLADPEQIKSFKDLVKRLTGPDFFENFLFMPVVRDMSAGQRTLLYNWLDSGAKAVGEPAAVRSLAHLSGSLRRL